jgi:transcriptional regulator with XRE-family HTH domain
MAIYSTIKAARLTANLTQKQLAALTGITQPQLSKIERGIVTPSTVTIQKITRALKIQITL